MQCQKYDIKRVATENVKKQHLSTIIGAGGSQGPAFFEQQTGHGKKLLASLYHT
jgi:hypothetical protein